MGMFSKLRSAGKPQVQQSEEIARGVLALPLLVAAADGQIDDAEINQILNMCSYSPIFHAIGAQRTLELGKEIVAQRANEGAEPVFARALEALPAPQRETALCFAVRAALADGHFDQSEKDMLMTMGERMGVPAEKFVQIFEVTAMMQRPAAA